MAADLSKVNKVAIYLRKSRGDEDADVVAKHRARLIEYAQKNKWRYEIYNENVVSGESLIERPVIMELLRKIENKEYDAVLVVHWDRLSRGDTSDFGVIKSVFQYANTYILTPERSFDLNDNADLTLLGIQSVMSNTELNIIRERLLNGKKGGAKQGRLTNGNPPYPYIKVRNIVQDEKGRIKVDFTIEVDEEKNTVYQRIKQMYLQGINTEKIAFQLNKEGIPSPSGKMWSSTAINRLLRHEFHMGKVIYGKYKWTKTPLSGKLEVKARDESEWSVGFGNHPILKTQEEHQKIMEIMSRNQKIPRKSRAGVFPTSGLLVCKKCGRMMTYSWGRIEKKTGKLYHYTKCYYKNPFGEKCPQKGVKMDENFYNALYDTIITNYVDAKRIKQIAQNNEEKKQREKLIKEKKAKLQKEEDALRKARKFLEEGVYDISDFTNTKKEREPVIQRLKKEIAELENENEYIYTDKELEKMIDNFKKNWHKATTAQEQNHLLRSIVKKIYYDRTGDIITFEIEYL
jgi:site-specific DNA recombinase